MLDFIGIVMTVIAAIGFVLYERANSSYVKTLKNTINNQNNVIMAQQSVIRELGEKLGEKVE